MRIIHANRFRKALALAVTAMAVLCIALGFGFHPSAARAAGNEVFGEPDFVMNMDVNGKAGENEALRTNVTENNARGFSERQLDIVAVVGASNYEFVHDGAAVNNEITIETQVSNYLTVRYLPTTKKFKFTALAPKIDARVALYFKENGSNAEKKVLIRLDITANFAVDENKQGTTYYVDGAKNLDGSEQLKEFANNSIVTIDLGKELVGRSLFKGTERSEDQLVKKGDTSDPWTIENANRLTIDEVSTGMSSIDNCLTFTRVNDPKKGTAPIVMIDVKITQSKYDEWLTTNKDKELWTKDKTDPAKVIKFPLEITVSDENRTVERLIYDVIFTPGSQPFSKRTYPFPTELNASSTEEFISSSAEQKNSYRTVRVYARDLVEFPGADSLTFISRENATGYNDKLIKVTYVTDESDPYFQITGDKKGNTDVVFRVVYTLGGSEKSLDVLVPFTVYGQYTLSLNSISGKKARVYKMTDAFSDLKVDNFYFNNAPIEYVNGSDEIVMASIENNALKVKPLKSGTAEMKISFINLQGKIITLPISIQVNYEGGSIFANLEDWQAWLIIAGGILVAIALLLFIIWLFYRGISRRKQDELATSAPTSAYIIKLNSTIAAAQAQQRLATTQAFTNAQTQMLQLGAGPTTTAAPPPNTLQLGAAPAMGTTGDGGSLNLPPMGDFNMPPPAPPAAEEIYIPMSDEELLERIFVEKYEPRGMARRSFFKSKDLQNRELEKEKNRIREDVRSGMSIEEACKSEKQREQERAGVVAPEPEAPPAPENTLVAILGFDPDAPLVTESKEASRIIIGADGSEKIDYEESTDESTDEEARVAQLEQKLQLLERELKVLSERLDKSQAEMDNANGVIATSNESIDKTEEENRKIKEEITDLEVKLATAKNKDKEKLSKDISSKEDRLKANKDTISKLQSEIDERTATVTSLTTVIQKLSETKSVKDSEYQACEAELSRAREELKIAQERMARAKAAQELMSKMEVLVPMMVKANTVDQQIRKLENEIDAQTKDKNDFKAEVSSIQSQLLGTTDVTLISNLSARINELNKTISEIDKNVTAQTRSKSDLSINLNGEKRKANEFIDKENIELEDVIREEDKVLGDLALEELKKQAEIDKAAAEEAVNKYQAAYDDLINDNNNVVMETAVSVANQVKEVEDELAAAQAELDELTARMEEASDDDKLMMSIDQMSLSEKIGELGTKLEEVKAQGIKTNLEVKMSYERDVEIARENLDQAKQAYEAANDKINNSVNTLNPVDLIMSGSGVISQDRQRLEAANLKKQLEQSKNAIEQARLQAQMAQMDAQKAIIDAQRASDASKAEAERLAQEAIAKAEAAKAEAEAKANEEAERAKAEAEAAKAEAEAAKLAAEQQAEAARREAEEAAERAKAEAEEAKRAAEQQAEAARREAEEQAEQARRQAEEEAQRAKREAEEEAERARKQAEEAKRAAEEEAEKAAKAEAERQARVTEKVAKRKNEIAALRNELKNITDEASGKDLREKFYSMQLALDEDEKTSSELKDLLNKSMEDADHAAELARYKEMANRKPETPAPRRIIKKVTERVNKRPPPKTGAKRPAGARPARPGARPAGARPGAARPGARPAGARPAARPGARPAGARPSARPGARPAGARPAARPGARPAGPRPGAPRPPRKPQ